jgi:lactate permease
MQTWTQSYTPVFESLAFSALVAAIPIAVLLGLLAWFRARAHVAALLSLSLSLFIAVLVYRMPYQLALMAAVDGAAYGLFPIGWIVLCAIFVYDITVRTGKFEIVKQSVADVAADRRIQALLVAISFGAFMEGAAGFGTPVAIAAAMLIGLGFKPLMAAVLALIGNTAPVAFGALGTPIIALSDVTGLPMEALSSMVGRQLPIFSLLMPFWLIWVMSGRKGMLEVWPACLATGLSFAVVQFLVSNYHGPWVVDIAGSIVSLLSMFGLLKFWHPKTTWRFEHDKETNFDYRTASQRRSYSTSDSIVAWMPWIVMSVLVFVWGLPQTKNLLNSFEGVSIFQFPVPLLDKAVFRNVPIVPVAKAEVAVYTFNWLSATGTSLLLSGIISGLMLGTKPLELVRILLNTLKRVSVSLVTIAAMMALGFITRFAGLDATMGLAFATTGFLFPFFSPILGWLGVALTGSDTSSNVLFGSLQQITAKTLGVSPILAAASNSTGGVMGKMIDAQSIVVAGVATNQKGGEGNILRRVFYQSVVLASLVGVLVFFQAYFVPWMIPKLEQLGAFLMQL